MEGQSRVLLSALPCPAFVVDATKGISGAKFPWLDAGKQSDRRLKKLKNDSAQFFAFNHGNFFDNSEQIWPANYGRLSSAR